ncbi:MAG: MCP four helix bundle domain-containing protein, partial [Acidobacteriota bacterium]
MKNVRIGIKLIGCFLLVAAMTATVAFIGYSGLHRTEEALRDVAFNRLPSVQSLQMLSEAQTAAKSALRTMMIPEVGENAKDVEREIQNIQKALAKADQAWKVYEQLPQTKEEAALWKKLVPEWEQWKRDVKAMSDHVQGDRRAEALTLMKGKLRETFYSCEKLLEDITKINLDLADQFTASSTEAAAKDKLVLIIGSVLCVLAGLLAGVVCTRMITVPVGKSVAYAKSLALGDLTGNLDIDQKDELGILAQAMREVADAEKRVAEMAAKVASGDLNLTVEARSPADTMLKSFATLVASEKSIAELSRNLSVGDLRMEVKIRSEHDDLMRSIASLVEAERYIAELSGKLAEGDLRLDVRPRSDQDLLLNAFSTMVSRLTGVVTEVQAGASNMAAGSEELASSAQSLSQATTEQAAALEESSASMEEMSSSISQNADNARQTEGIAIKAAGDARESGEAMIQTVAAMKEIAQKISIIEEIARQTD